MNELLIYGPIDWFTSAEFIRAFSEVEGDELTVRVNSGGGNPEYTYGMIAKWREFTGKKKVKVDGKAHSSAGFFVLFASEVEAIQQARFIIHRAAYPDWYESNYMTEEEKTSLESFNQDIYAAFKAKIDVPKFEEITGKKLKDIFSMNGRIEVELTAKQAKQVGLISKVVTLTPEMHAQISAFAASRTAEIAANSGSGIEVPELEANNPTPEPTPQPTTQQNKKVNMTIAELQAQHPELFASVIAQGVSQERDRVGAWMAYHEIDAKKVAEGIKSGNSVSQTEMAEFSVTAMKKSALGTLETEATTTDTPAAPVTPPAVTAEDKAKELAEAIIGKPITA